MSDSKPIKNEQFCFNKNKVTRAKKLLPKGELLDKTTRLFDALGDPTRLKILYCISRDKMCVCDISNTLDMSLSAISHQLRILRNLNLVKFENKGKMSFYSLADDQVARLLKIKR